MLFVCVVHSASKTDSLERYFTNEEIDYEAFGELPKRGNLTDILECAGANELLWTTTLREDPYDPEGHEAKRKAGWYSAVALWVFAIDSMAVIDAVKKAANRKPRSAVLDLARQCRKAPNNWRE